MPWDISPTRNNFFDYKQKHWHYFPREYPANKLRFSMGTTYLKMESKEAGAQMRGNNGWKTSDWETNIGNTICDSYFNNELCDWDGGDCCTQFTDLDKCGPGDHCTCHLTGKLHKTLKSEYGCRATGNQFYFGNGYCNSLLNVPECRYDGGDCCIQRPVTSSDSNYWIAGVVPCTENIPADEVTVHSHAWIYNDHFNESETGQIGNLGWSLDPYIKSHCNTDGRFYQSYKMDELSLGNGRCDDTFNTEQCLYDFGDCCLPQGQLMETLYKPRNMQKRCVMDNVNGMPVGWWQTYVDPVAQVKASLFFSCPFHMHGDRWCWGDDNVEECHWDMGDCCLPTPFTSQFKNAGIHDTPWTNNGVAETKCHLDMEQDTKNPFIHSEEAARWINLWPNTTNRGVGEAIGLQKNDVYNFSAPCIRENIGNKQCEAAQNHAACEYDGGDCCLHWGSYDETCGYIDVTTTPWPEREFPNFKAFNQMQTGTEIRQTVQQGEFGMFRNTSTECRCHLFPYAWIGRPVQLFEEGCPLPDIKMMGDGICDDDGSYVGCMNDYGDCCKTIIDTSRCTDCLCPFDDLRHASSIEEYTELDKDLSRNKRKKWHMNLEAHRINRDMGAEAWEYGYNGYEHCFGTLGNGRCDDLYNYEECLYDSGDCCRPIIQGECDDCICHEDGKVKMKLAKPDDYCVPPLIGDGRCQRMCNVAQNMYDNGDCCLASIIEHYCHNEEVEDIAGDCVCHEDNTIHPGLEERGCPLPHLARNNVCNDITNVEECNWDAGDCCGRLRMNDCMICKCHVPLSQSFNGTTYQWSAINYRREESKVIIALFAHKKGLDTGNWQ